MMFCIVLCSFMMALLHWRSGVVHHMSTSTASLKNPYDIITSAGRFSFADLLAPEDFRCDDRRVKYHIGGNATLGGASMGGRYFRVAQRMVGTLTRLDEIGQQPNELTSGSHPTYTDESMPLFFKATALDDEETLGTTKERAMFSLASLLFGRGVADTAVVTAARHTTVNIRESKRDHPLLKWEIFAPDPRKFQNPAAFDDNRTAYDRVKQQQRM